MQTTTDAGRTQYSEQEAARMLGIAVEDLRSLVSTHIVHGGDVPPQTVFQASDLVVLRLLARMQPAEQPLGS